MCNVCLTKRNALAQICIQDLVDRASLVSRKDEHPAGLHDIVSRCLHHRPVDIVHPRSIGNDQAGIQEVVVVTKLNFRENRPGMRFPPRLRIGNSRDLGEDIRKLLSVVSLEELKMIAQSSSS